MSMGMSMKVARLLLVWTWVSSLCGGVAGALRFATFESQDEVLEGESRLLTAVELETSSGVPLTDGAATWGKEFFQLLISCEHGTLQLDREVARSLVDTAFLCVNGDPQLKRSIGVLTTPREAQQILSSIVYQPDANYRSTWYGVTGPLCITESSGNEVVRMQLSPVNVDAPMPSKDTCIAVDMADVSAFEAEAGSTHEKKVFVRSVNDPPNVERKRHPNLSVRLGGSCVGLTASEQEDDAAILQLKFGGNAHPPDMLIREAIMTFEDTDMLIGGEVNLDAFVVFKAGSTVDISVRNGVVYSVGDSIHMDASSKQQISTNDLQLLQSVMLNMRYIPNPNFNGIDEIDFSAQGQTSTLYIYVQAENDPPKFEFDSGEMNDWYKYPRMFLPSFRLDDPDKDQTFQVDIRVDNGTLFVEQMSTSAFDGVSVEFNSSFSSLRLTSGLDRLNTLFLQRLVEIMPKSCLQGTTPTSCAALIELCANDGFITYCEKIKLPEQDVFYHVVVSSGVKSLNFTAGSSLNVPEAFKIQQRFDVVYDLLLRVHVSSGFFRVVAPNCGELRDFVSPDKLQPSNLLRMTQLIYMGDAACLNKVLTTIQLQSSYGSNATVVISVELLTEEMRLLANESISVKVTDKPTPIQISVVRTSGDELWLTRLDSCANLTALVNVSLVADPETTIDTAILELMVSCLNCQWKYRSFVPQVSYEYAQIPSSRLGFLGVYESLRKVIATLQLAITNDSAAAEVIHLHMTPALPLSGRVSGSGWNSSTDISIPFTLHSSNLSWEAQRSLMFVQAPNYTVELSGVKLTGKEESPSLNLTIRMNCTLGQARVSLPRVGPKFLELPCGLNEPPISLTVQRSKLKDVIRSALVKVISSGRESRVQLHLTAVETAQIATSSIADETSIDLEFRASPQQPETKFALRNESSAIQVDEKKVQTIGDILTVTGSLDEPTWFRMLAHVTHGRLYVPLDVCCVEIRGTQHENELDMIGTALALIRALASVQFQGHELYSGKDLLEVTVVRFPSRSSQPNTSFGIPIDIVAVSHTSTKVILASVNDSDTWSTKNDAPVIPSWSQPSGLDVPDTLTNDESVVSLLSSAAPDTNLIGTERESYLAPKTTALVPLIHIEGSVEGPLSSQYWEVITLELEAGRSWSISGIYIRDSSGESFVSDDDLTLKIDAEIGAILLVTWDGLQILEGSDATFTGSITVVGKLDLLNAALLTLRYQCSGNCNRQDTVTFQVNNPLAPPPEFSHKRAIRIDLLYDVPVPYVTTNASLHYSTEDAAFQFPNLTLRFADINQSLQAIKYIQTEQRSQLWSAELSYRSTKYSYPRSRSDDIHHRFVGDFVGENPPHFMCQMGNFFYFAGSDGQHGEELWVSDGSKEGTGMVVDLLPGREGSSPTDLVAFNGKLIFTALGFDLTTGREMWASDGSAKQTYLIADIRQGPKPSNPQYYTLFQSKLLLFQAETDEFGVELFKTDGTKAGTIMVEDIWRGPRSSKPKYFAEWTAVDGRARMYFAATSDSGRELWVSDALSSFNSDRNRKPSAFNVAVGTLIVKDICTGEGSSSPRYLVAIASVGIFFSATDCIHGRELWFTDGSNTGTRMVKDLNVATNQGSNPTSLVVFGGKVCFQAQSDSSIGRELYVSDGTATGTTLLVDLVLGALSSAPTLISAVGPITMPDGTTRSQGLAFTAIDSTGRKNVWLSDGTTQGTIPLLDEVFLLGHNLSFSLVEQDDRPQRFLEFGNAIYFATHDFSPGRIVAHVGLSTLYQLDVRVSYGFVFVVSTDGSPRGEQQVPKNATNELKLEGTAVGLENDLNRMVYLPPQNWNEEQFPGEHIVEWQFVVSYENKSVETFADLVITPRVDTPVLTVPQAIVDPSHYMSDYLSVLRLECLPLVCDEDTPMLLDGFLVRATDATQSQLSTTDLLVLILSVSRGVLTLGDPLRSNCISQFMGPQSRKRVSFKANADCMNRILSGMTYVGEPNFSGADQFKIRIEYARNLDAEFDEVTVPISVVELNDAPYIDVRSVFYEAVEDVPLLIEDLYLRDPDAFEDPLRVVMETSCGQLALLRPTGINLTAETIESGAMRLTLEGTLFNLNAAIAAVAYTSAKDWNSLQYHSDGGLNGFDTITINSSDSSSFNASSVSVLFVYVDPDVDPVVIGTPSNVLTSVYVNDPPGTLRGDEDTRIGVSGLAFSSVDDTSQMTLVLSLSVGHGILSLSQLRGVTFVEGTRDQASTVKVKGTFVNVNRCVAGLSYIPFEDYYGNDSLVVTAHAIDEYTQQQTPSSSISVAVTIDPVNDAPVWNIGSSVSREIQQGRSASIAGVYFRDVDVAALDCAVESCVMDLIVEASHGFVTLSDQSPTSFSNDMTIKKVAYVVVSGTPDELNTVLSTMTFELAAPEHYRADHPGRTDIKLQLTVDDRGTFGRGGPQISTSTVVFSPVTWSHYDLSILAPERVLEMDEDTTFDFNGDLLLLDPDSARSFHNLLELTVSCTSGVLALSSQATGIQVLRNESGEVVIRGYFAQLNAALNGSFYIPEADWYGSEKLSLSVVELNRLEQTGSVAVAAAFLFVAPICDEPQWRSQQRADKPLSMKEDGYMLIDSISLTNPDLDDEQREVEVSISVEHGGVMLSLMKGLLVEQAEYSTSEGRLIAQHVPPGNAYSRARLFFKELVVRGRVSDINSALKGMIFKPSLDYNSDGWPVEEISFVATSSCGGIENSNKSVSSATIAIAVVAVNDPPVLLSKHFQRISSPDSLRALDAMPVNSLIEAVEDLPQPLEPLELYDPDCDLRDGDLRLLVNISCIHCTITSMNMSNHQPSDDIVTLTTSWRSNGGTQLIVHGSLASLNNDLMNQLTFRGADNFNGIAFVLIEISDLGNYGEGGEQHTLFALGVEVRAVNDIPLIHLPQYQSQEPILRLDEDASVLIVGAPALSVVSESAQQQLPEWSLMSVNLIGNESTTRLYSLNSFLGPKGIAESFLVAYNGGLLFSVQGPDLGKEIWYSDGTAVGTVLLKDIFPGSGGSNPSYLTPFSKDNRVYFAAEGPHLSWQIEEAHRDGCQSFRPSSLDPDIYFTVAAVNVWDSEETYDCPLGFRWMSTSQAQQVFLGTIALDGHSEEPLTYFDQCGWRGYEWGGQTRKYFRFSDSKVTGAFKHAGFRDSYRLDTGFQTDLFAGIVCYRESPSYHVTWGSQLWATDGTAMGTQRVAQISTDPEGSNPSYFVELNQRLYFQATSPEFGAELWSTDGTRTGTYLVADVEFGSRSSKPRPLTVLDSRVYFSAETQDYGRELWFSNGDPRFEFNYDQHATVGTGLLLDICPGAASSSPQHFAVLTSLLLFQADDCVHGPELWSTDGTRSGTSLVVDIRKGSMGSSPRYLTSFAGRVYFQADDGVHGSELWTTDGTTSGTVMLLDLAPGVQGSTPSFLTILYTSNAPLGILVFSAQAERDVLTEFWQSDGTSVGTNKLFPQSREVVELNVDSLNLQLAGSTLVAIPSQPDKFFYLGRESGQGVDFRSDAANRLGVPYAEDVAHTRSITLQDVGSMIVNGRNLTLSLNCSKGWLSLGKQCSGVSVSLDGTPDQMKAAVVTLEGTLDALNCAVERLTYHAKPQENGWDEIHVTLSQGVETAPSEVDSATSTRFADNSERDSSYTVSKRMLVEIRAINDPPSIGMASTFYAPLRQWVAFAGIEVADPDSAEKMLYVSISVRSGRLRVTLPHRINAYGPTALHPTANGDISQMLEFATTVEQAKEIFSRLEYNCDAVYGCSNSQRDYLTVQVDDNGFSGAGGPQVATKTAEIIIMTA